MEAILAGLGIYFWSFGVLWAVFGAKSREGKRRRRRGGEGEGKGKEKESQGCLWTIWRMREGGLRALNGGGPPPGTKRGWFLRLGPPRNLQFSMPISASNIDEMLATFWPPKAPTVDPKTIQNGFQNQSQNEAKINMGNYPNIMKYDKNARC